MKILKSIGAVLAGFIAIMVLSAATDAIFEHTGVLPSVEDQMKYGFHDFGMQVLTLVYRFAYTVVGGFVVAKLAPSHPWSHVIALAVIATALGILGLFFIAPPGIFPVWYSAALILIGFPSLWIGGKFAIKKKK